MHLDLDGWEHVTSLGTVSLEYKEHAWKTIYHHHQLQQQRYYQSLRIFILDLIEVMPNLVDHSQNIESSLEGLKKYLEHSAS